MCVLYAALFDTKQAAKPVETNRKCSLKKFKSGLSATSSSCSVRYNKSRLGRVKIETEKSLQKMLRSKLKCV